MLKTLQNKLRQAEDEYDDIYQTECAFKDDYSYRRISRAQADVRRAEKRLTEFYLLNAAYNQNNPVYRSLSDNILEKIMSYL